MNDKLKRMTAKERQTAKENRALELATMTANLPKPKTVEERQQDLERYRAAHEAIGKEIERQATIETLDRLFCAPS